MGITGGDDRRRAGEDSPKARSVRSVERAIELLQALNRRPSSTLHELHEDTGLPKPSLIRFLRTFEGLGLVGHRQGRGSYHLLGPVRDLSSGFRPPHPEIDE